MIWEFGCGQVLPNFQHHHYDVNQLDPNRIAETHQASLAQYLEPRGYETVIEVLCLNSEV